MEHYSNERDIVLHHVLDLTGSTVVNLSRSGSRSSKKDLPYQEQPSAKSESTIRTSTQNHSICKINILCFALLSIIHSAPDVS